MVWFYAFAVILIAGSGLTARYRRIGAGITLGTIYLYFQISSWLFLVPGYKDGGNGSLISDWVVWLINALICTGVLWVGVLAISHVGRRVRKAPN